MDVATCITKDCDKPRFMEYYVCAEHFVVYADPRYTESLLIKVDLVDAIDPPPYPDFRLHPEAPPSDDARHESPPPEPAERKTTKRARIS